MKNVLSVLAVLAAFVAVPAMAGDGNVAQGDLSSLGLGQMQVMSDAQGLTVRGMSSNSQSTGLLLASSLLFDPITGSDSRASLALFSRGTAENAGLNAASNSQALIPAAQIQNQLATTLNGNAAFAGLAASLGVGVTVGFGQ